nr:hypothetical protein [Kibdelosporangium sp. MJ126-NF4]CTQ90183.1 hypothetical protein [Kibdelosporangium sp. MJ126-NF4]
MGATVAALVMLAPAAVADTQGIYEWEFGGYYPTYEECAAARAEDSVKFRCYPPDEINAWELWNGYYT